MPTKITVVYDNPKDPGAFEAAYSRHLAMARELPGIERMETSKVWPKEDGTPTPAYRLLDLYFADYDAAGRAAASPAAEDFFPDVFGLATGGARILFADIES